MRKLKNNLEPNLDKNDKTQISTWVIVLIFLIPVFVYIPGILGKIPYPSDSALYSDLMLTHYPNALYLKQSIIEYHQIPLWSTLIHSGAPFAANPLAGLFYLPGWLALLFPLPEGISVILAVHAVFGSWGMYQFLKEENIGEIGAIAGGVAFGLMPKVAAHYGAGHVSLIYAISWTPWLLLVSRKDQKGWKTGITAALLFLADPRWAVYAGMFWFSYDIAHRQEQGFRTNFLYYLRSGIIALLIASPLILPMYEFVGLSTRLQMGLDDIQAFSLAPAKILNLIIPASGGNPEWYLYSGGIIIGLFLMQIFIKQLRKINRFWSVWVVISLLISFGSWLINPSWLVNLPIISLLRVPSRAFFLAGYSLTVITARSIDSIIAGGLEYKRLSKIAFGLALFSLGMALSITYLLGKFSIIAIWGFGFLFLLSILILISKPSAKERGWIWILVGLMVVDLFGAGIQSYYRKDKNEITSREVADSIKEDTDKFRLYSPSYSFPQYLAAENGFELTDGVDPLQVAAYSEFMDKASGVTSQGYSVTIPAFNTGNPALDNTGSIPNAFLLGLLNVKYVISEFMIDNPDLHEIPTGDQSYLYVNSFILNRAWIEDELICEENYQLKNSKKISNLEFSPNRIGLTAYGPGRLVLSEVYYPGWKVIVDGDAKAIEQAYGVLRSVDLTEGEHEIKFNFQPISVYIGLGLAAIGWTLAVWQIRKDK